MPGPYLLDTTVLLHWTRNSPQAQTIDANFQLSSSAMRPLVCEVSLGEMLAFSLSRNWGAQKVRRLAELERHVLEPAQPPLALSYLQAIGDENERMVAQIFTSWNPLISWLRQIEAVRTAA